MELYFVHFGEMRAQVGAISSCTNNSDRTEFLKVFTGTGIITQCTARKEAKISG